VDTSIDFGFRSSGLADLKMEVVPTLPSLTAVGHERNVLEDAHRNIKLFDLVSDIKKFQVFKLKNSSLSGKSRVNYLQS
jgi:hypothetical protein